MRIIVFGILIAAFAGNSFARTTNVVCYLASWAVYRYGNVKFDVNDIDYSKCTHLIYSFIGVNRDGTIRIMDEWTDFGDGVWNKGLIPTINSRKGNATKVLVAMGGWNEGSEIFSQVTGNPATREVLCQSILKFVKTHGLDGFDLDWEYPAQRGGKEQDKQSLSLLLERLYALLHAEGYILSIAVTANSNTISISYDIPFVAENVDMINVMTYDLHGSWDSITGHNAPLRKGSSDPDNNLNVEFAIKAWITAGANPQKLNLGIGAYGRSFSLLNPILNFMGAPAGGLAPSGWIPEAGFYSFIEICKNNRTEWTTAWDEEQVVPYAYSASKWVGYDDVTSVRAKTCFAKELNLGGLMVWSIDTDDFKNICGQGKYPLVTAIWDGLADPTCGNSNDQPGSSEQTTTTGLPLTTLTSAPTTVDTTTTTQDASETTVPTTPEPITSQPPFSTTIAPTSEPSTSTITTTELPSNTNDVEQQKPVCIYLGQRFRHSCSSYWVCASGMLGGLVPVLFPCPIGLQFDTSIGICNYRSIVKCA